MRKVFQLFLAGLIIVPSFSQAQKEFGKQFNLTEYKLQNGLTVILNENHEKPEVFGMVAVRAGSKNDPADATGMAHYQEHMLFKGTTEIGTSNWEKEKIHIDKIFELYDLLGKTTIEEERKKIQQQINDESVKAGEFSIPNEFDKILKSMGGTGMNANTSWDRTVYFNTFPTNQMEKWLDLYSHRFMNPVFRLFQAELEVVYEEKNLYADNFGMSLFEFYLKNFFRKHPYGQQTTIGTLDHLKNPSLTKMYQFFKTYYVANNMALIISGDFNTEEIKPMIEAKFGRLASGNVPEFPVYEEKEFNGREFVEAKMSPVKLGIIGFRTVKAGDNDQVILDVCNRILSNNNQTGLLDKLNLENKLLGAQLIGMPLNDYGINLILMIPKILGQSLEEAEKLVMTEVEKLGKGEFEDWLVDAVKYQLYMEHKTQMESNEDIGILLSETFAQKRPTLDALMYAEQVKKVTKADVIRIAQKYYGKNFLVFYSKMGFPKKDKLDKPGFKPIIPKADQKSSYVEYFENLPAGKTIEKGILFDQVMQTAILDGDNALYCVKNPLNDIFTLELKFGIGSTRIPRMAHAADIMNYAGTKSMKLYDLKSAFSKIGCEMSISCDADYFIIELSGIEENLEKDLVLLKDLIENPVLEKDKLKNIVEGEQTNRKIEKSEPDNVAQALFEYVKYKNNSEFVHRLSLSEIKSLNTDTLVADFKKAMTYHVEIHYTGSLPLERVQDILVKNIDFKNSRLPSESPVVRTPEKYSENTIFFIDDKKAVQSKIKLLVNGGPYTCAQEPIIDAFNQYFSGDFSGLVLQEIREYRSLAYGAGARYVIPKRQNADAFLSCGVNTQADKTLEALQVFFDLIQKMPEKRDRTENIKNYLEQALQTEYPGFRDLSQRITDWKMRGFTEDPLMQKLKVYKQLTFDDILSFYKKEIQSKSIVIAIVGDKKRIDMKGLAKFGKIVYVKKDKIFH
ncbi:MAG: insulinase family protein [Bacteroidota bacterium]